jgi:hypothetical protein
MTKNTPIPIYTTRGDLAAYLVYPYIHNLNGEWIGWVTQDRKVHSVHGQYVGYLDYGPRIIRKVSDAFDKPRRQPPADPGKLSLPPTMPLSPLMPELPMGMIDVLDETPDLMPTIDAGEREDMD